MTGETQRAIALGPQKAIQAQVLAFSETVELTAVFRSQRHMPCQNACFVLFLSISHHGEDGLCYKRSHSRCVAAVTLATHRPVKSFGIQINTSTLQIANPEPTLGLKHTPSKSAIASHVYGGLGTMCIRSIRVALTNNLSASNVKSCGKCAWSCCVEASSETNIPNLVIAVMTDTIG